MHALISREHQDICVTEYTQAVFLFEKTTTGKKERSAGGAQHTQLTNIIFFISSALKYKYYWVDLRKGGIQVLLSGPT
jgi:hypothetical protein